MSTLRVKYYQVPAPQFRFALDILPQAKSQKGYALRDLCQPWADKVPTFIVKTNAAGMHVLRMSSEDIGFESLLGSCRNVIECLGR